MSLRRTVPALLAVWFLTLITADARAVELWYDFETDMSPTATDKLLSDGAQDGAMLGNISLLSSGSGMVPYGAQAALFQPPNPVSPPFSTLEIPGSAALGDTFTLAMHASIQDATPSTYRLFSNYGGTGAVSADRLVFDFLPGGMRAIVGGTVVSQVNPMGFPAAGYHHYALTVDNGLATLFLDGVEVGSGTVPMGNALATNLFVGEDAHDLGGTANEQLLGHVDDVVVLDQALSAAQIAQLAAGNAASSSITPTGSYAVNYDFEGPNSLDDRFVADGAQPAIPSIATFIDLDPVNAAQGSASLRFEEASNYIDRHTQIETPITGTSLGDQFTLSSVVNVSQGGYASGGLIRLLSSYAGSGSAANSLLLDFNPDADVSGIGIRLILPGRGSTVFPGTFSYDEDHTITAVYDNGEVSLYLNGELVASQMLSGGEVDLGAAKIFIGEDAGGGVNENLVGIVDDVLILGRAINANEVRLLSNQGVAGLLAIPEPASSTLLGLLGFGGAYVIHWRRGRHTAFTNSPKVR